MIEMIGALFSLLLISSYEVKMPDPYLGWGFNMFRERLDTATPMSFYRKFFVLGVPFKIKNNEVTDPYLPVWVIVPEFGYNTDITQFNFSAGVEGGVPMGYRTTLSSLFWGVQAGLHYNLFTLDGDYLNEHGKVMNSEDKTSIAFLVNTYLGPRFELSEKYSIRFLVNPRFILGRIAFHTYRSEAVSWFGFMTSFNFQLEFR